MRYTISEMAALLGVTTHTLRYYEKMGLIQPEVNRETGYRYYTVTDTRRFNLCRELRAKLALHEGVPAEQILCGNGAADLIFRLVWAKKPRRALVTAPTFAEYATALESVGCTVERFFLREQEDFAVTDAFCAAIRPGVDMVFLCQPNNPTGQLTALPLVEQILHRCAACGTLLVVDECFLDFLPDHALHTAKGLLGEGNLVILKAFTKLYGMAGVRLGYA